MGGGLGGEGTPSIPNIQMNSKSNWPMDATHCIWPGWETPLWAEVLCFLFVNLVADGMFGTLIVQLRVALVYSDTGDNPDTAPGSPSWTEPGILTTRP